MNSQRVFAAMNLIAVYPEEIEGPSLNGVNDFNGVQRMASRLRCGSFNEKVSCLFSYRPLFLPFNRKNLFEPNI